MSTATRKAVLTNGVPGVTETVIYSYRGHTIAGHRDGRRYWWDVLKGSDLRHHNVASRASCMRLIDYQLDGVRPAGVMSNVLPNHRHCLVGGDNETALAGFRR